MKPKGLAKSLIGTSALTAAIVVSFVASSASAATQTYDDTNGSNFWDFITMNWDASTATWTNGNSAIFGGTGESLFVDDAIVVDNITFNSTGYTLLDGLGSLTMFDGNSDVTVSTGTATIGETIGGSGSLTKLGTGTLVLSAANTYTGGTSITGILNIANDSALGTGAVTVNNATGNQLQLAGGLNVSNALTINGGGVAGQGVLHLVSGNSTYSGIINITAATSLADSGHFATGGQTSTLTIAGDNTITSSVPVTIRNGIVKYTGSQSYTGGTTLATAGAMIHFAKTASMPASGTVALSTGTTLGVNVGGVGEFTTTGTGAGTIAGLLAGTGGQGAPVTLAAGSSLAIDTTNAVGNQVLSTAFTSTNNAGLLKLGTGTLELTAGGTFNGVGYGGFPLIVRQGTLLLNGGAYTAGGETVIGGTFGTANGDAGYDAKLQIDSGSLAINNWLSVGRGNGTGTVSSDLVLNNAATVSATNFSAGFNANSTANTPKGTITLNNSSALTITGNGAFFLAESSGSNMTMTLNGSSTLSVAGTGNHRIGIGGGTGVLTLNGTSTATFGGTTSVGYGDGGNGTVTINSGTLTTNNLNIAQSTAAANNVTGTVTVQSGGTLTAAGDLVVGLGGTQTGSLILNGGTVNAGTTTKKWLVLGQWDTGTGQLDINSGTLKLNTNTDIRTATAAITVGSTSIVNQNGGDVTFYSNNGTTVGGTGVVDLQSWGGAAMKSTYNLNGGTLTANKVTTTYIAAGQGAGQTATSTTATGTRTFNFNGGTLKVASNTYASDFFNLGTGTGTARANVRNGGAIIDTNGINVTVAQALLHSNVGGDNAIDGGFTKNGAGILTLTGVNTYTGATTVNAGTLLLNANNSGATGNVSVLNANTTLGGNGTVGGATTLNAGTKLSAGAAAATVGTFTFANGLNLAAATNDTGAYIFDLGVVGSSDMVAITAGTLNVGSNLSAADFTFNQVTGFGTGTYTLFDSNTAITGTVDSSSFTLGGFSAQLLLADSGTNVVLSVVPEPSAALLGGLGALGLLRRRRKA